MAALLAKLTAVLDADPLIDEYALVPCASEGLFGGSGEVDEGCLAVEHKLAISLEAAVVLYRGAHQAMLQHTDSQRNAATLAASTRAVLLCCADCAGAWQRREELLNLGTLDLEVELRFVALLLRTNHKSGETWAYRRHLLSEALQCGQQDAAMAERTLKTELELVEELARKYDHHYYAWNHWAWLGRLVSGRRGAGEAELTSAADLSFPRLAYITPSHYGLFHHRLVRLQHRFAGRPPTEEEAGGAAADLGLPASVLAAFAEERTLASALLSTFPHMEAPWNFRLQLFAALLEFAEAASRRPSTNAVRRVAELWRAEVTFAAERECEAETAGVDVVAAENAARLARRFRLHLLQELAAHLGEIRGEVSGGGCVEAAETARLALVEEALGALNAVAKEGAAAAGVLIHIRADLQEAAASRSEEGMALPISA